MLDRKSLAIASGMAAAYVVVSLDGLTTVPAVGDDEVWIASSAHKLATEGVLGSDLMKGFAGGERHTYHHLPLYAQVLAVVFRCAGTSALTMRMLPSFCGLLVLLLVFALGRRLGGAGLGNLAMAVLLLLRGSAGEGQTGILLHDVARIGRYDILVPVFGLAALLALSSSNRGRWLPWLVAGGLIACSALTHAYGAFLLVALVLRMAWGRGGTLRPRIGLVIAGFLLPLLPWVWFVANGWSDFKAQMAIPAGRFDLLAPSFYALNLLHEAERYRGLFGLLGDTVPRPGAWAVALGVPAALVLLVRRFRRGEGDPLGEIAVLFVVQALLFATLLHSKQPAYAIVLWPLLALLLGSFVLRLWRDRPQGVPRAAIAAVLLCLAGDGVRGLWQRHAAKAGVTPYDAFEARLRAVVPRGARVLGLPRFWLGLQETDYRTWAVPFNRARSPAAGVTLRQALEAVDPEIVLVDADITRALDERTPVEHPYHSELVDVQAFFAARSAAVLTVLEDPTYGPVKVYRLLRSPPAIPSPPG